MIYGRLLIFCEKLIGKVLRDLSCLKLCLLTKEAGWGDILFLVQIALVWALA